MQKFKSNLQAMRKRAGFKSARAFAEHAGINVKTYTNHEQGEVVMSLLQAWEYADLLDCTLDELAGRKMPTTLTPDEREIVDGYRVMDGSARRRVLRNVRNELEDIEADALEKKAAN